MLGLRHHLAACAALAVGLLLSAGASAQTPRHIRGTVTGVDNHELSLQTAAGKTETVKLADNTGLFLVTPADFAAITPDKFVGITSVEQDGKRVAREVHVFADTLRGLGEGHYPWDLDAEPNMMTNANIAKVDQAGGDRVLKLAYKGGEQTIAVPPTATIVEFNKTTAAELVAGRKVFVIAKPQDDGSLGAVAVVIGAEGVKPPM